MIKDLETSMDILIKHDADMTLSKDQGNAVRDEIVNALKEARADERERCIKEVEGMQFDSPNLGDEKRALKVAGAKAMRGAIVTALREL